MAPMDHNNYGIMHLISFSVYIETVYRFTEQKIYSPTDLYLRKASQPRMSTQRDRDLDDRYTSQIRYCQ